MSGAQQWGPCPEWEERLSALTDGDLCPEDQRLVETHLKECHGCRCGLCGATTL